MKLLEEISDSSRYVRDDRKFHLHYGTGEGGGQFELAWKFNTNDGEHHASELKSRSLCLELLEEAANLKIRFDATWVCNEDGHGHTRIITDTNGSNSSENLNISKHVAACLMLPETSTQGNSEGSPDNVLYRHNYWFDFFHLTAETIATDPVVLTLTDPVIAWGQKHSEGPSRNTRLWHFNLNMRVETIVQLCKSDSIDSIGDDAIANAVAFYRGVYLEGNRFNYREALSHLSNVSAFLSSHDEHYEAGTDVLMGLLEYIGAVQTPKAGAGAKPANERTHSSNDHSLPNSREAKTYAEGARKTVTRDENTRNRRARAECLELKGTTCAVCGFNSTDVYGIPGIVEVHHLSPLADNDEPVETDPERDLVPLCPNCHRAIHRPKGGLYTINELRGRMALARQNRAEE